ncbi:MAG: DNA polymerase sliding clamp, partial [Candidatus Marsarchaeota archaeon]|nr:DNA polymerase sliding clamp [Candidatus Marsarchaeota archaeon]
PDAKSWGGVFSSVSKIVDEITVSFKKTGVYARAMDSAHLAMVDLQIPSSAFETYTIVEEANLGVKLDDVNNVLRRAGKSDKLGIFYDPKDNELSIKFLGQIKREFSVNLLEVGENTPSMPNLPVEVTAVALPGALRDAVKDVGAVSDYAVFEADSPALLIRSKSSRGSVKLELTKESGYLLDLEIKQGAKKPKASYGIKYLEYITSVDDAASVSISFSTGAPLKLDYRIPNDTQLVYLLAPRADDD